MPSLIKSAYETCECNSTCGLSPRKCLRLLSVIGMISSIVYIGVGSYIIVYIVQTEKVEWFPNSYYSNIHRDGPIASRIVVPPPDPPPNVVEDFDVHVYQQQPQSPFLQNAIFPADEENDETRLLREEKIRNAKAIYYRRHVGLFICLAATLIIINTIQFLTDICLFHSTLKGKRSTSLWVFFLLDIILWIMTLICFITIFSGGGIFLLLVFLIGTTIRVYIVYVLHEVMSDMRKPRAWSSTTSEYPVIAKPEPRSVVEAEEGSDETAKVGNGSSDDVNDEEATPAVGDSATSSRKSLQPTQGSCRIKKFWKGEDENETGEEIVEAENQQALNEMRKADVDDGENDDDGDQAEENVGEDVGATEDPDDLEDQGDGMEDAVKDVSDQQSESGGVEPDDAEPVLDEEPDGEAPGDKTTTDETDNEEPALEEVVETEAGDDEPNQNRENEEPGKIESETTEDNPVEETEEPMEEHAESGNVDEVHDDETVKEVPIEDETLNIEPERENIEEKDDNVADGTEGTSNQEGTMDESGNEQISKEEENTLKESSELSPEAINDLFLEEATEEVATAEAESEEGKDESEEMDEKEGEIEENTGQVPVDEEQDVIPSSESQKKRKKSKRKRRNKNV